jgi:hypothetical protein
MAEREEEAFCFPLAGVWVESEKAALEPLSFRRISVSMIRARTSSGLRSRN